MKAIQRKLAREYEASAGARAGNNREWMVVRKSDRAVAFVTVHAMCNQTAAIEQALRADKWALPGSVADVAAK